MPSAEIREGDFKYQGVLKMHGEIGEIKHALDGDSSKSLKGIGFDRKYNELVVIGSAVENIEVSQETTEASTRDTKSKASKAVSAEKLKTLAEKIKLSAEKIKSSTEDQKQTARSVERDRSAKKSQKDKPVLARGSSPSQKIRTPKAVTTQPPRSPTQEPVEPLTAPKNASSKSSFESMKSVDDAKEVDVSLKSDPRSESVKGLSNSISARVAQPRSTSHTERSPKLEERRLSPSRLSERMSRPSGLTPLRFLTTSTASEPTNDHSLTQEQVHRPTPSLGVRYVGRMVNPNNIRNDLSDETDAASAARSLPRSISASPRPRSRYASISPGLHALTLGREREGIGRRRDA
ncbi:hypothetical protein ANCCAN_10126 [Ancylostoma caninum]|uniref:Uncharacterized protein n=1 Tax=Ancylostoma caninum TaxID=29170 RepID=A0A368GHJ8_ANCCA|nr:hypothetical protein ANCCAN_10126 [Ancylostoma caninum]